MTPTDRERLLGLAASWDYTDCYECANELRALVAELDEGDGDGK